MKEEISAILFGKRIANRLVSDHPNIQMVFTYESIGDQCMELAYLREFQRVNGIERIGIITTNPNHALFSYFSEAYDELIPISKADHNTLLKFYKSDLGQIYRRNHQQLLCAFYTAYVRSDLLFGNRYVRLSDIEKYIYRIPQDSIPCQINELGCEEWLAELINSKTIIPAKTVLLNPYANSCSGIPISFFESVAEECVNSGFTVVTGIHADQQPIRGTKGIEFGLEKAISLANTCGYVVGIRSGFLDLCAFSKAKIISIDHDSYGIADATILEDWWPQNKHIQTYRYSGEETRIIGSILDYMQEGK